jgi:O-acetyl-ADP-ribose deacetylase (regulator of RNase III)
MSLSKLIVVTRELDASKELQWAMRGAQGIEVHCGPFEKIVGYDCIATAGNSFGLMDAGMDLAVLKFFGQSLQERIQRVILDDYLGEQLVGTSFIIASGRQEPAWVAHTPTMRIPMNVTGTDYVYLATWATLLAVHRHNRQPGIAPIRMLVCPAFATGTGGVSSLEAGIQMRVAWEHFQRVPSYLNPSVAQARQERVHFGGTGGFKNPRPSGETRQW